MASPLSLVGPLAAYLPLVGTLGCPKRLPYWRTSSCNSTGDVDLVVDAAYKQKSENPHFTDLFKWPFVGPFVGPSWAIYTAAPEMNLLEKSEITITQFWSVPRPIRGRIPAIHARESGNPFFPAPFRHIFGKSEPNVKTHPKSKTNIFWK